MTINFYVTSDEKIKFLESYKVILQKRLKDGDYIFSQSRFFMEILDFYRENYDINKN